MAGSNDLLPVATETVLPIDSHKAPGSTARGQPTPPGSDTRTSAMAGDDDSAPASQPIKDEPASSVAATNGSSAAPLSSSAAATNGSSAAPLSSSLAPTPFGHAMRNTHFRFAPSHLPINHGSYGLSPHYVHQVFQRLSDEANARPDPWMRYTMPAAVRKSREHVARLLHCPANDVVLVPNTSTATDCVLRNLEWQAGDVLVYYVGCYGAFEKSILYSQERSPLQTVRLDVTWPIADDDLVSRFEAAIARVNATPGQRVRMLVFDTVVSLPGQRVPWERLCAVASKAQAWSLVDGAHGIGQIPIDLGTAKPTFFATNLHKWLFVPRGCAAFYVAPEAQDIIRATLPISHSFVSRDGAAMEGIINPLPSKSYGKLADLFDWVATIDYRPYMTVEAALAWRERVCGGEDAIQRYCIDVAQTGADRVAAMLGTEVMQCEGSSGRACALSNVLIPVRVTRHAEGEEQQRHCEEGAEQPHGQEKSHHQPENAKWAEIHPADAPELTAYLQRASATLHDTYFHNVRSGDRWWWRLSGQIYLDLHDLERAAEKMADLVERVRDGRWLVELEEWNS